MNKTLFKRPISILPLAAWLMLLVMLVASCGPQATPRPTDSGVTPDPSTAEPPAVQDAPTATPTQSPGRVLLVAPLEAAQTPALQAALADLAADAGLEFEALAALGDNGLDPAVQVVVAAGADPGLQAIAAQHPQVRFLAVGIPGLQGGGNLSVFGAGGQRPDRQGFIAGYLAAVITSDWRAGVLSAPDSPAGRAARNGFTNGLVFFCGLCRPAYPPFVQYPVFADVPANPTSTHLQAAVDLLVANAVKTVYVAPEAATAEGLEMLAAAGLQIIASGVPPTAAAANWVASVDVDEIAALRHIWPDLVSGAPLADVSTPLALAQVNPALFSPGRMRLVEEKLEELSADFIDTGVDPQTGDLR